MAVSTAARKPHQVYHLVNGDRVPGVTTILSVINKPALYRWNNRLGLRGIDSQEHLTYLADAGSLAHELIAHRLGGPAPEAIGYSDDQINMAQNAVSSFDAWARGKRLETQETELSLVSEQYQYGGTLDALVLLDRVLAVIDFKTSSAIYDDHCYQLSGYHQLLVENGYEVDEARIVRLSRDAGAEWSERALSVPELAPYWQVFKAALGLYTVIKLAKKRGARRW